MLRIVGNSADGRLNNDTFCSGTEVVPAQCVRDLTLLADFRVVPLLKQSISSFEKS